MSSNWPVRCSTEYRGLTVCRAYCGCDRKVFRYGLCYGHYKQLQREQPLRELRPYRMTARQQLIRNAIALSNSDTSLAGDDEFGRAIKRLFAAVERYKGRAKK